MSAQEPLGTCEECDEPASVVGACPQGHEHPLCAFHGEAAAARRERHERRGEQRDASLLTAVGMTYDDGVTDQAKLDALLEAGAEVYASPVLVLVVTADGMVSLDVPPFYEGEQREHEPRRLLQGEAVRILHQIADELERR